MNLDPRTRSVIYTVATIAFGALIVGLIVVDVLRGGDPATWVTWLAGIVGLGTASLAAKNTPTKGDR